MKKDKKKLGKFGERIACNFLKLKNFRILQTNFFSQYGEIDIIAIDSETLVFIEVKTRKSNLQAALNSVSFAKQKKITNTAYSYLQRNPQYENLPTRFDVIIIIQVNDHNFDIKHLKDAFLPAI